MLLQHGLLESSAVFVDNGPGQSLAFALADAGFDVWLSNTWVCCNGRMERLHCYSTTWPSSLHHAPAHRAVSTAAEMLTGGSQMCWLLHLKRGHSQGRALPVT